MKLPEHTDKQDEILLRIGTEIARIRGKEDMLHLIRNTIKQYIPFDDSFIFRYNKKEKSCCCYIYDVEKIAAQHSDIPRLLRFEYAIDNDSTDDPPRPEIRDVAALMKTKENQLPFIRDASKAGIKEYVSIKLVERNQLIGFLVLVCKQKKSFTAGSVDLLLRIKHPIAIATANIIANEEIANREHEKEMLLSLSNEIARARSKHELWMILSEKLRELFPITGFGITLLNKDGTTHSPFVVDGYDQTKNNVALKKTITQKYPVNDGIFNVITSQDSAIVLKVEELEKLETAPSYVQLWSKKGVKNVLGMALRVIDNTLGCLIFHLGEHFNDNISSSLVKGVSAQVAVAISNIKANEDIVKREEEKAKLLSFSNTLSSIVDRKQLSIAFSKELRKFGFIGSYGISIMTEDKKHLETILYDESDDYANDPEFKKILETPFKINEEISAIILNADHPVTFSIRELKERKIMLPCVDWWYKTGILELTGIVIKLGNKRMGFLWLGISESYDKASNYPLLKSISSQVGIALSNLLANEKIVSQLNEIKTYKDQLENEIIYLQEEIETSRNYSEIIGESKEVKDVFRMIAQVAHSDSTVLLLGETGTGKELIARAIHNHSQRKNKLMVKINCAALPANLVESELFGHEKGSFTGAIERRIGKFELANNGTLFLDEIGEMPMDLQVKLLRALQEKEIERVGGKTTIKTDVRIIAATNRDLEKLMEEGKFRSDLYYRLNIFPIELPPLRNRREDIPLLVAYFIARYSKKAQKKINGIQNKALQALIRYDWPGNIRELEHLIERSILLTNGNTIKEVHLPQNRKKFITPDPAAIKTIDEHEKEYILKVLKLVNGKIGGPGGAAELLGLPSSTLNSRMKRLGIRKEHLG